MEKIKTCEIITCENTDLVYSGVDAFIFGGIPTEKYCYSCAIAYMTLSNVMSSLVEKESLV